MCPFQSKGCLKNILRRAAPNRLCRKQHKSRAKTFSSAHKEMGRCFLQSRVNRFTILVRLHIDFGGNSFQIFIKFHWIISFGKDQTVTILHNMDLFVQSIAELGTKRHMAGFH